jgi:hypothetical protein
MKNILLVIILIFIFSSGCEKDNNVLPDLTGVWVEETRGRDTLIFNSPEYNFGTNWFDLRKQDIVSTGPYEYRLFSDSISIHWFLSSSMSWHNYYFKMTRTDREFMIGRFYESEELKGEILSFVKVE